MIKIDLTKIEGNIKRNQKSFLSSGIFLTILGILAIILPNVTAVIFNFLFGGLIVFIGSILLLISFITRSRSFFTILGLCVFILGIYVITNPSSGTLFIATILGIFFLLEAIFKFLLSKNIQNNQNKIFVISSGLISFCLSFFIFYSWPQTAVLFLGIAIGINILLYGISLIFIAKKNA